MKDPWKALPWVASISLHASAFFFVAGLLLSAPAAERQVQGIDLAISFAGSHQQGGPVTAFTPQAGTGSLPRLTHRVAPGVSAPRPHGVPQSERLRPPHLPDTAPPPGAGQVEPETAGEEPWSMDGAQPDTGTAQEGPDTKIGWDALSRKLIRRRDPQFPPVLSALGQEVECEARITVAPSGGVTRVEITRSSGYTEIDAGVEAALRDYLFSRADGTRETVGTVRFRFRLEKTD